MAMNLLRTKAEDPTDAIFGVSPDSTIIHHPISEAPHFLVAGTTGSGKSVFINNLLITMLSHAHPDELKLAIIDPKQVEFTPYEGLPHMLADPIIELNQANDFVTYLTIEMDRRYRIFKDNGVKKLPEYNELANRDDNDLKPLPYIVTVIDEFSDLIGQYKEIEKPVVRIGQKARAAGIHAIIATQSPRREVITGLIKANFPSKVSLMVASATESQIILGETGGEKLKPRGDMLIKMNGGVAVNAQSPFQTKEEIDNIFNYLRENYKRDEPIDFMKIVSDFKKGGGGDSVEDADSAASKYKGSGKRTNGGRGQNRREAIIESRNEQQEEEKKKLPKKKKVDMSKISNRLDNDNKPKSKYSKSSNVSNKPTVKKAEPNKPSNDKPIVNKVEPKSEPRVETKSEPRVEPKSERSNIPHKANKTSVNTRTKRPARPTGQTRTAGRQPASARPTRPTSARTKRPKRPTPNRSVRR